MSKTFEKYLEIAQMIEHFHSKEFKVIDIVHNDLYRHMNDAGLFDYQYIDRGQGLKKHPSKTNLVFLVWLMIAKELKAFGMVKSKLHKVKDFLFKEFDITELFFPDKDQSVLLKNLEHFKFDDQETKDKLTSIITSDDFFERLEGEKVSRIFWLIFEVLALNKDIQLCINTDREAYVFDELELSKQQIEQFSYESKIVLPLKKYLMYFVGEYAPTEFLTRSRILNEQEAVLLEEFRREDIQSLTIKYKQGQPNTYETKTLKKLDIRNRLSSVLMSKAYEDIVIKTKSGSIYYSELTHKQKF